MKPFSRNRFEFGYVPLTLLVRAVLLLGGLAVLALGVDHLPETATTRGELAIGMILSLAVALQILVAALFFPMAQRR